MIYANKRSFWNVKAAKLCKFDMLAAGTKVLPLNDIDVKSPQLSWGLNA